MNTKDVIALGDRTADAYSYDRYGRTEWRKAIRLLDGRGFNEREIEAILRSKWMRWAGDAANRGHRGARAADLATFMNDPKNHCQGRDGRAEVAKMVAETFPAPATGADLAGACEGEDIAALIDLARMVKNGVTGIRAQQIASDILVRIEARAK